MYYNFNYHINFNATIEINTSDMYYALILGL